MAGLLVFTAVMALTQAITYHRYLLIKNNRNRELTTAATVIRERIQSTLANAIAAATSLHIMVKDYGIDRFDSVSKHILELNKNIDGLSLVEGETVSHIYPLEGNEAYLGYNIFRDTISNKQVRKALKNKQLYFAGPYTLVQGGQGIIGRSPIFHRSIYYGFATALIKLPTLLRVAHLDTQFHPLYVFQLSKVEHYSGKEVYYLPQNEEFDKEDAVRLTIPEGDWNIYAAIAGPKVPGLIYPMMVIGMLLSAVAGVLSWYVAMQPAALRKLVGEKMKLLRESEREYTTLFHQANDAILVVDNGGRLMNVNDSLCRMLHYTRTELLQMNVEGLLDQEQLKQNPVNYKAAEPGMLLAGDRRMIKSTGETVELEWSIKKIAENKILVIGRDVTEQRRMQTELRQSEEKFRSLVEQSLASIFIYQGDRLVYVNPAFEKASGYSREQLIDKMSLMQLVHDDDKELMARNYASRLEGKTLGNSYVLRMIRSDDAVRHIEMVVSSFTYANSPAVIGTVIDITERLEEGKRMERAVLEAQERERLHIGMELHDNVKQILAASRFRLTTLASSLGQQEPASTMISDVKASLAEAINELRRLSHRLAPSVDPTRAMDEKVKSLADNMNTSGHLNISVDVAEAVNRSVTEETQLTLYRILQEQLLNIAKYAAASEVTIQIDAFGKGGVSMSIKDNGQGYDPDQTKDGIGLENIRRRAGLLDGKVEIVSAPGMGCKLTVQIP